MHQALCGLYRDLVRWLSMYLKLFLCCGGTPQLIITSLATMVLWLKYLDSCTRSTWMSSKEVRRDNKPWSVWISRPSRSCQSKSREMRVWESSLRRRRGTERWWTFRTCPKTSSVASNEWSTSWSRLEGRCFLINIRKHRRNKWDKTTNHYQRSNWQP